MYFRSSYFCNSKSRLFVLHLWLIDSRPDLIPLLFQVQRVPLLVVLVSSTLVIDSCDLNLVGRSRTSSWLYDLVLDSGLVLITSGPRHFYVDTQMKSVSFIVWCICIDWDLRRITTSGSQSTFGVHKKSDESWLVYEPSRFGSLSPKEIGVDSFRSLQSPIVCPGHRRVLFLLRIRLFHLI